MSDLFGSTTIAFAEKQLLVNNKTRFCLTQTELRTQQDGRQMWWSTIYLWDNETLVPRMLTLGCTPKRDKGFQHLIDSGKFPQHSCYLTMPMTKNPVTNISKPQYALGIDDEPTSCPCGVLDTVVDAAQPEESADLGDLDDHPF